jgi:hypothetical protein
MCIEESRLLESYSVALERTDISEESSASIIELTRAARCNIPEECILHSHRSENLKSYTALSGWTL